MTQHAEPRHRSVIAAATVTRLEKSRDDLAALAVSRMADELEWFEALTAQTRSYVALVAQAGISGFVHHVAHPELPPHAAAEVFAAAPRSMAAEVSLRQVVDLVRLVVDVIEAEAPKIAAPGDEHGLREAVLLYSREVAFGAALVYAAAAEQRGAWDARLEALVLDAVLSGEIAGEEGDILARAAALNWDSTRPCWVLAGGTPEGSPEVVIEQVRKAARGLELQCLAGVHGKRLVAILGHRKPRPRTRQDSSLALADFFADGAVVMGSLVEGLGDAQLSAASALAGLDAVGAWPDAPRPVDADDLLPERVLVGDEFARRQLLDEVYDPLSAATTDLLRTAEVLLDQGGSLEAAARVLYLHPNTVRYRLRKIVDEVGLDLTQARGALTVGTAIRLGRLRG